MFLPRVLRIRFHPQETGAHREAGGHLWLFRQRFSQISPIRGPGINEEMPHRTCLWTLDHRRLYAMKAAGCSRVRVCITQGNAFSEFANKYKLEMRKDIKLQSPTSRCILPRAISSRLCSASASSPSMAACSSTVGCSGPVKTATKVSCISCALGGKLLIGVFIASSKLPLLKTIPVPWIPLCKKRWRQVFAF